MLGPSIEAALADWRARRKAKRAAQAALPPPKWTWRRYLAFAFAIIAQAMIWGFVKEANKPAPPTPPNPCYEWSAAVMSGIIPATSPKPHACQ